jgi:DNA-directed RNA polymerase subunit beta'
MGFKFATIISPTITLDDIEIPKEIYEMKEKLDKLPIEEADILLSKMEKMLVEHMKNTGLSDLILSGAGKGWGQPMQILVAKGIISDPKGRILTPIKGSFSDGLSTTEFFDASQGARKGLADRVLNTSSTGYLSRKLSYVLNTVELDLYKKDCGTKRTLKLKLDSDLIKRLIGRYVLKGGELILFENGDFKPGDIIELRSPIYCESKKICHTCYGELLKRHKTPYVGILASQILGERGTQLIMRTFHTGGAVTIKKKDVLSDIIENNFELDK